MKTILLSRQEVAHRAQQMYESGIRQQVHSEENIGRMVIIDIETGNYEVDEDGLVSATHLSEKNPTARLFGICIGYNVSACFSGVMERVD
jgi:hypothetical protein